MKWHQALIVASLVWLIASCAGRQPQAGGSPALATNVQMFEVQGTIQELKPDGLTAIIQHEAISNYMEAMTMPFRARASNELAGLRAGDIVIFRLSVTEERSWIDRVTRLGSTNIATTTTATPFAAMPPRLNIVDGLAAFAFTNEFAQPINFADYKGQALGLTFFFTRCPLPEYCPRLSKNFVSATRKLKAMPNAPTNWHFFSITIDTERDTPRALLNYGKIYGYDSNRWTFATSSQATIEEVARRFGFNFKKESGIYTHQFLTLVLDANGYSHAGWPVGGDTSDNLVAEIVAAANPTNTPPQFK